MKGDDQISYPKSVDLPVPVPVHGKSDRMQNTTRLSCVAKRPSVAFAMTQSFDDDDDDDG
jgi:hypothetical protein